MIAERLSKLMLERGIGRSDMASLLGLKPAAVRDALNGKGPLQVLEKIAQALGVSIKKAPR